MAVGIFFALRGRLGTEFTSWLCILGAAPFAALGFVKYNQMTAEQFAWAWLKAELLLPKILTFQTREERQMLLAKKKNRRKRP